MSSPSAERRRFLKVLGLASVGAALAASPARLAAQPGVTRKPASTPKTPPPATPPAGASQMPPDVTDEAKKLLAIVEQRYGKHLDAKQLEAITRELEFRVQGGRALRALKLGNHDEPDTVFRA